jgi:hypothetical protein
MSDCSDPVSLPTLTIMKVFLRVRPMTMEELHSRTESALFVVDESTVEFIAGRPTAPQTFNFTKVHDVSASQETVFQDTAFPLVQDVLAGKNALLFTYGVTNSGKTYTMQGDDAEGGLLSRSLDIIFNSVGDARAPRFTLASDNMNQIYMQVGVC